MSGPWTTPPAGADLPPRNGNVQMYHTRQIYPRNDVTGNSWTPGRELVFQFESDPASGWLVPDQCKLYARFSVGTKGGVQRIGEANANGSKARIPSQALRFAACPIYGALSAARYSQNGVTVQAQGAELDTLAQLQLRLMGSRESHDTNGILGCDSLRQKMMHPEAAAVQMTAGGAQSNVLGFDPQVIPNDKHKILLERYETNKDIELATPVSLALTSFGINKFICGGSHDLRFTIGQEGRNLRKSMYTQEVPATPLGSGSVVSDCNVNASGVDAVGDASAEAALAGGTGAFVAADAATRAVARSRCLARYAPAIPAYDDTGATTELEIDIKEVYLMATYALPVAGTVPRPLSSQYVFDHITLLTKQLDNTTKTLTQQFTIPVNTTRIILGLREGGTPTLAVNRELLGRTAGKLGHDGSGNGRITSASITLAGQVLPQPAYQIDAKDGKIIRPWSDWQGFLKSSIGNTAGAQNLSEFEDDMLLAFRIMGARDSVAQNLTTRLTFGGSGTSGNTELLVFCIGQQVWENQFDDDSSFMPTSVSVEEVV
eukprot:COSAG06_NODE_513_length_14851_cov_16.976478_14_plen_546_part_00